MIVSKLTEKWVEMAIFLLYFDGKTAKNGRFWLFLR